MNGLGLADGSTIRIVFVVHWFLTPGSLPPPGSWLAFSYSLISTIVHEQLASLSMMD
jgi:hypothetical protein